MQVNVKTKSAKFVGKMLIEQGLSSRQDACFLEFRVLGKNRLDRFPLERRFSGSWFLDFHGSLWRSEFGSVEAREKCGECPLRFKLSVTQNKGRISPACRQQPPMPGSSALDGVKRNRLFLKRRGDGTQVPREDQQFVAYPRFLLFAPFRCVRLFHESMAGNSLRQSGHSFNGC